VLYHVGFIGLGAMGTPMAWNIRKGGFDLQVYNRTPMAAAPFREAGVRVCESPRPLAARSDVTVIMVTGPDDLLAVLGGEEGVAAGLTPGKVVVNMSTVSPDATAAAAALVHAKGAGFVDAPVSGTTLSAQQAKLVILAGAAQKDLDRVKPMLKTMGQSVIHCGPVGQGTRMKLILNLLLANMMQSLADGLVLGKSFGLDPEAILDAIGGGPLAAPMFQAKGRAIIDGDFSSQFPVRLMLKDLNLVLEAAGKAGVPLPQTAATRECFSAAMAKGYVDKDMAAVIKVAESITGRRVRD